MILAVLTVMVAGGVSFVHGEEGLEDVNMDFLPSPHYEYWHDYGFDTEDTFWRGMGFDEDHPPRVSDIVFYLYGYSVDINDFFDRILSLISCNPGGISVQQPLQNKSEKQVICELFDSFVKTALRRKSRNLVRDYLRRLKYEEPVWDVENYEKDGIIEQDENGIPNDLVVDQISYRMKNTKVMLCCRKSSQLITSKRR